MPSGPAKMPTALRILHGNPQKKPLPPHEPKAPAVKLDPPPEIKADPIADAMWGRISKVLADVNVTTTLDFDGLVMLCTVYSQWAECQRSLREDGWTVEGYRGATVRNPAATMSRELTSSLIRLLCEYGMTPSSRTRVHVAKGSNDKKSDDPGDLLG